MSKFAIYILTRASNMVLFSFDSIVEGCSSLRLESSSMLMCVLIFNVKWNFTCVIRGLRFAE